MKIFITGLMFFLAAPSWAGTETHGTGGGGDAHNPWNLGDAPVDYCVEIEEGTPYDSKDLHRIADESFKDWKKFFIKYGFDKKTLGDNNGLLFKDRTKKRLTLDFQFVPKCTDLKTQIRILFREKSEGVPAWESPSGNALGSATRGDYNHDTFRNGGTVWVYNFKNSIDITRAISPEQAEESRNNPLKERRGLNEIKHVLLHELGHIFGMKHNEVWVMHERAAEAMIFEGMGWGRWDDFGTIEYPAWRYHFRTGEPIPFEYSLIPGVNEATNQLKDKAVFKALDKMMADELELKSLSRHSNLFLEETLPDGRRKFSLQFKERAREEAASEKIYGTLEAVKRGDTYKGPAVHTIWEYLGQDGSVNRVAVPVGFDDLPAEFPATGHLEWKGKAFPVSIEYRYGPIVKIFFPSTKRWLVIFGEPYRRGLKNELDF
ncbi:hypothetical protein K2X33_06050 [bacterium]|nr:hypothetical protein [bacterium]